MPNIQWRGVYPAATTQMKRDESIDIDSTLEQLDVMVKEGVDGLILLGTVGENGSLDYQEKIELITTAVRHIGGRVPVLTGVAEASTRTACRFAADAEKAGVNGLMVLPAMIYKADASEAKAHFRAVAAATDLPIMIYNNPVSYGIDLSPNDLAELANEPKFVAIKESSEDVRRITDIRIACGDRYQLFCGVDDLILESLAVGATGWVSGLVNAFPAENRRLWDLATSGRWDEARALYRWYTPLLHLDTHPKLVQYIKLAAQECGLGAEWVRAPRYPLAGAERERILKLVRQAIAARPQG